VESFIIHHFHHLRVFLLRHLLVLRRGGRGKDEDAGE
jgi:hypothetical protein